MYAMYLDSAGRFDEAFREFQIARQLDPVSLGLIRNTGEHFRYLRQYDRAIAENRKVLEMDPGFEDALESLSHAYANKGMYEESIKVIEQLSIREGEQSLATTMKTAYARGGYKGALINRLQFYKDRRKAGSFVAFWDEALLQVQMGNQDLALAALEKACDEREDLTNLNVDPFWDNLRSDPRFQDLIRRIGIPVNGPGVAAQ